MTALRGMWPTRSLLRGLAFLLVMAPVPAGANCADALATAERLQELVSAESTARDALVTIRRNAQDWKNLLLRGRDPVERQAMQARFDAQARAYVAGLAQLRVRLGALPLELDRVAALESEQVKLFERYRSALARHGVASLEAAAAADRDAQGADVATFRALEQLIEGITKQSSAQFQELRAAITRCAATTAVRSGEAAK